MIRLNNEAETLAEANGFIVEEILVRRMKAGEWIELPMRVSWHPETCSLEIAQHWRKRLERWADVELYRIEPIFVQKPFEGLAYRIHRTKQAVADDPHHVERYEALVATKEANDICSCWGHYGNDRCKHIDALRWLGSKLENAAACDKCGQTDCELVDGLCADCKPALLPVTDKEPLPEWLW